MQSIDYLNVSIRGHAVELFVNGAPILRTPEGWPYMATPTVSEWFVHGDNEIAVRIDAIAPPPAVPDPLSPHRLVVQRCVGPLGAVVPAGEDVVLGELVYLPPAEPPRLPLVISHRFTANTGRKWAWETAPALSLDADTTAELLLFLEALHADLEDGDIDGLLARQRIKIAELAPRYGSDAATVHAGMHAQFSELAAGGAWSVAPLRPEELVLRPCCGGRLVEPRTRDGEPALRGRGADATDWALSLFIARIGGMFEIVR
jgi:hypothetical protein